MARAAQSTLRRMAGNEQSGKPWDAAVGEAEPIQFRKEGLLRTEQHRAKPTGWSQHAAAAIGAAAFDKRLILLQHAHDSANTDRRGRQSERNPALFASMAADQPGGAQRLEHFRHVMNRHAERLRDSGGA